MLVAFWQACPIHTWTPADVIAGLFQQYEHYNTNYLPSYKVLLKNFSSHLLTWSGYSLEVGIFLQSYAHLQFLLGTTRDHNTIVDYRTTISHRAITTPRSGAAWLPHYDQPQHGHHTTIGHRTTITSVEMRSINSFSFITMSLSPRISGICLQ